MKSLFYVLIVCFLLNCSIFSQSQKSSVIKLQTNYGSENIDLMSVLYFENIGLSKLIFSGGELKDKDFQLFIKQFDSGKLKKEEIVFDSKKEGDYFKVKDERFIFRVLSKSTPQNTVKLDFQFNGFAVQKEYEVEKDRKGFALKDFLGSKPDVEIPLNKEAYILTYMMPYVRKDGSTQYCEVAQSGSNPEELGIKYNIPTYFLIGIRFS